MSNCYVMSYNGKQAEEHGKPLTNIDRLVMIVSDPLLHSEFLFSVRRNAISYSVTLRDDSGDQKGCRFKKIRYTHPERWNKLLLPMTDVQEDRAYKKAVELEGLPYDTIGVASLKTGLIKENPDKYWCSEVVAELIKAAYEWGNDFIPSTLSPNDLYFRVLYELNKTCI